MQTKAFRQVSGQNSAMMLPFDALQTAPPLPKLTFCDVVDGRDGSWGGIGVHCDDVVGKVGSNSAQSDRRGLLKG
jgi:hypothetical protein